MATQQSNRNPTAISDPSAQAFHFAGNANFHGNASSHSGITPKRHRRQLIMPGMAFVPPWHWKHLSGGGKRVGCHLVHLTPGLAETPHSCARRPRTPTSSQLQLVLAGRSLCQPQKLAQPVLKSRLEKNKELSRRQSKSNRGQVPNTRAPSVHGRPTSKVPAQHDKLLLVNFSYFGQCPPLVQDNSTGRRVVTSL